MGDLFKKLKTQNKEFRKNFNPLKSTGCCGGRPIKDKKIKDYNIPISQDDPINF